MTVKFVLKIMVFLNLLLCPYYILLRKDISKVKRENEVSQSMAKTSTDLLWIKIVDFKEAMERENETGIER